jgi:hypothetical protein
LDNQKKFGEERFFKFKSAIQQKEQSVKQEIQSSQRKVQDKDKTV